MSERNPLQDRIEADHPLILRRDHSITRYRKRPGSHPRRLSKLLAFERAVGPCADAEAESSRTRDDPRRAVEVRDRLVAVLDDHIVGQTRAKTVLVAAGLNHLLRAAGHPLPREVVLLLGPTGCGKTAAVKALARALGCVLVAESATDFSRAGYVGLNISDIAFHALQAAEGDQEMAETALILFDEIDKTAAPAAAGLDVSFRGVQQSLLGFMEGATLHATREGRTVELDTSRNLVVFAGAFEGLEEVVAERLRGRERIGFRPLDTDLAASRTRGAGPVLSRVSGEDLIAYGLLPELVGRLTSFVVLEPLTKADLITILTSAADSPLEAQKRFFACFGVDLDLTSGALDAVAERALERGTGARALSQVLNEVLGDLRLRAADLGAEGTPCVVVDRRVVERGVRRYGKKKPHCGS